VLGRGQGEVTILWIKLDGINYDAEAVHLTLRGKSRSGL